MRRVCDELVWLSLLFAELQVPDVTPIPCKYDNQEAICIASHSAIHEHTKQIELDCHFIHEKL